MVRLTQEAGGGHYRLADGQEDKAIDKLGRFEDFADALLAQQPVISKELEVLRLAGKKNTSQFRELMTKKLINGQILTLLQFHGLD